MPEKAPLNIVVMTSDKQIHAIRGFAYLFNKYFSCAPGTNIVVAGFTPPDFELPSNFKFFSIGKQEDYPWNKWSNGLLRFMDAHPHWRHFIIMLEDYWIVRHVDTYAIYALHQYAIEHPDVLRVDLCADRLYAGGMTDYGHLGYLDIIKSDYKSQYHMSLWASMFNQDLLRRIIVPDESPHDVELEGTNRLSKFRDEMLVIGTRQYPLRHITVFKHSEPGKVSLGGLRAGDIEELRERGYL